MCLNVPAKIFYLWIKNSASIPKIDSFFCFRCKHGVHVGGLINFGQWRMLKQDSTLSRWARSYHIWTDLFLGGLAGSVYRDLALSSKRFIPPWLLSLVSDNRLQCSSRPPVFFSPPLLCKVSQCKLTVKLHFYSQRRHTSSFPRPSVRCPRN